MPVWFAPLLKALPHLATIAQATGHVFTKRKGTGAEGEVMQQQIAELQAAASQTDSDVRDLATRVRDALATIEQGAALTEARMRRLERLCIAALAVAALALVAAVGLLLAR
ncbi:MAG: hypothetical protein ABI920_10845 [Casimicrobiaceae bacterium]